MKPITGGVKVEGCMVTFQCGPVDASVLGKLDEPSREGQPMRVRSHWYCALDVADVLLRGTDTTHDGKASFDWPTPAMARAYADAVLQSLRAVNARFATPDAGDGWEAV